MDDVRFISTITLLEFLTSWYRSHADCNGYLSELDFEAYDDRRKGASIIEWMFFARFKKQLPSALRFINSFVLISNFVLVHVLVIVWFLRTYISFYFVGLFVVCSLAAFNVIYYWTIHIYVEKLYKKRAKGVTDKLYDEGGYFIGWIEKRGKKWDD